MAELIGVVGSAVGIMSTALELAHSIKKLKDFCVRVADAPTDLQRTIDDIEAMSSLLTQLNDKLRATPDSTESRSLRACVELCGVGVNRIAAVTAEFDRRMVEKRRQTSLRFVFGKDLMQNMMHELERAKGSLLLAHQLYGQAQAEDAVRIQQQQIATLIAGQVVITEFVKRLHTSASPEKGQDRERSVGPHYDTPTYRQDRHEAVVSYDNNPTYRQNRNKTSSLLHDNKTNTVLTVRTPVWLRKRIWELSLARAVNSWTCSLKVNLTTYRIVEWDSPVVKMCRNGDLLGLQRLFSAGEASPLDRLDGRWSLFREATYNRQMEVARFLYDQGAAPEWHGYCLVVKLWESRNHGLDPHAVDLDKLRHDLRFLLELCDHDPDDIDLVSYYRGAHRLRRFTHGSQEDGAAAWQWFVLHWCIGASEDVNEFLYRLNTLDLDLLLHDASLPDEPGALLKLKLLTNAYRVCQYRDYVDGMFASYFEQLIIRVIQQTLSPLAVLTETQDYSRGTLLDRHLHSVWSPYHQRWQGIKPASVKMLFDDALRQWVQLLERASVDLRGYGALERTRSRTKVYIQTGWLMVSNRPCDCDIYESLCTLNLAYGEHPKDWHFWWSHPGDSFAGDFWDMIDHPERTMPGAWTDDSSIQRACAYPGPPYMGLGKPCIHESVLLGVIY